MKIKIIFFILIVTLGISCQKDIVVSNCQNVSGFNIDKEKIIKKVLIIGIDGFRSDVLTQKNSPFLHELSNRETVFYNNNHIVEKPTISGPNWSSILTGVKPDKHNVINNSFDNHNLNHYPSLFYYIEDASSEINTTSIVNWTPINNHITQDADFQPIKSINDLEAYTMAMDFLEISSYDILFLHFDELDGAGHNYGFSLSSPEYCKTLNTIDSYVSNLFTVIENKRSLNEDWIFIVISDHGGEGTSHSDSENPMVNQTIFLVEHPELQFKKKYISSQLDIAPTILDFIGINHNLFNCKTDGHSLIEN